MGKKGSKRKTRWRTLSIGAPPGEEDEEGALRNGYVTKGQENDSTTTHSFDRNGQTGYKPRRTGTGSSGATSYANSGARIQKDESAGSPSQPKIIFNEDEYTRITTPRQDVLFKKGYLSRKKPWAGNASTSATPSTTESQSASHSTADGSETTEDQQLLDRDSGTGEYPPIVEPGAQLGYGTFYDHASGYYYEYPVMLVGPAPVPAPVGPSVLATIPCGPVPLRPIEWINPAFVPKLGGQSYCVMDYQASQNAESAPVVEEQVEESVLLPAENSNGTCNENGTRSASCNGSITGEPEEQTEDTKSTPKEKQQAEDCRLEESYQQPQPEPQPQPQPIEEHRMEEHLIEEQHLENGMNGGPYLEPVLMQQPVHVSHVLPTVPQPYMYPGHYMFGPPLVNVNGVTIQSGPMIRTTDIAAMTAACAKRRKKKKRRKQRRPALGNAEDEEEGEYSSECDNGLPSSRLPWTVCPNSTTTTSTTTNRPLNPECQEFQLRTVVESQTSLSLVTTSDDTPACEDNSVVNESSTVSPDVMVSVNRKDETCNGSVSNDAIEQENELAVDSTSEQVMESALESSQLNNEAGRLTSGLTEKEALSINETKQISGAWTEDEAPPSTDVKRTTNDLSSANEIREWPRDGVNGINISSTMSSDCSQENLMNGKTESDSNNDKIRTTNIVSPEETTARSFSPLNGNAPHEKILFVSSTPKSISTVTSNNVENHQPQQNHESSNGKTSIVVPKRKYSMKGLKFVREPTPGPDLDDVTNVELENDKVIVYNVTQEFDSIDLSNGSTYSKSDSITMIENSEKIVDKALSDFGAELSGYDVRDKGTNDELMEGSNEDSGFESQTRRSEYPITEAVTEWLRKANSPNIFKTCAISVDSETEDEDEMDEKPPKNLQGNPMPALSANSDADNLALSRTISCGEFARTSNIKLEQVEANSASAVSKKKRDVKGTKRKSAEKSGRRVVRNNDDKVQNDAVSSSDSCSQKEESTGAARKKHLGKQDVGEVCEFTEKDSVAGMRVASSSRMDSKRVSVRRAKRLEKYNRDPVENIDVKIRCIEDTDNENDEGIVEDTVSVRTFEKGEIIVTEDGKLLTTSSYEPVLYESHNASTIIKAVRKSEYVNENKEKSEKNKRNSSGEEENGSMVVSLESIEEPDVLECWEAETIEPVITPKRMLQSQGVLCEGEAAEEDNFAAEQATIEHVEKYYRLARGSATSIEEETAELKRSIISSTSRTVPNSPEQMIESFCSEEIPVVPNGKEINAIDDKKIPIDEAFEVYESYYTGKAQFLDIDSKVFKPRTLYGQDGEGPIPCKAVCCNIQ